MTNALLGFLGSEVGSQLLNSLIAGSSGVQASMDVINVNGLGTESAKKMGNMQLLSQGIEESSIWELLSEFL